MQVRWLVKERIRMVEWFYLRALISMEYGKMLVWCAMRHPQPCNCQVRDLLQIGDSRVPSRDRIAK